LSGRRRVILLTSYPEYPGILSGKAILESCQEKLFWNPVRKSYPGILSGKSYPGILSGKSYPGILSGKSYPGILSK
jgi:hypothetical protein